MTGPTAVPESEPAVPAQSLLQRGDIRALLFGLFIVFTVGFAGASVLHGAAHDTRHSVAFPCH